MNKQILKPGGPCPCCGAPILTNDPLTLEELQKMDGQAVWCEDEHCAGIISVDIGGKWAGVPFLIFRVQGVNCTYNIKERGLSIYRRKPEEGTM